LPVILSILGDIRGVENSISLAVTPLLNNIRELATQTQVFHRITHHVCAELEEVLVQEGDISKPVAARLMKVLDDYLHEAVDPVCGLAQGTESIFYIIKDTIFHRELEVAFNEILEKPNELLVHLDDAGDTFKAITGCQKQGEGGTPVQSARGIMSRLMSGRSKQSSARSDGSGSRRTPRPDSNRTPRQDSHRTPRDGGTSRGRTPRDSTPRSGGMTPRSDGSGGPRQSMSAQHFIGDDGG
jgi:hypothetical protein